MKKIEAINHARKYLVPNSEPDSKQIERAAGMLVFAQDTRAEPYKVDRYPIPRNSELVSSLCGLWLMRRP